MSSNNPNDINHVKKVDIDYDKYIESLEEQVDDLQNALMVASNQLEGVVVALKRHGDNINVPFWIQYYQECANKARLCIHGVETTDQSEIKKSFDKAREL